MLRKLYQAAEYPKQFFSRLVGIESYKIRVGEYRIICEVDHTQEVIHVLKIGHRKNVYD